MPPHDELLSAPVDAMDTGAAYLTRATAEYTCAVR